MQQSTFTERNCGITFHLEGTPAETRNEEINLALATIIRTRTKLFCQVIWKTNAERDRRNAGGTNRDDKPSFSSVGILLQRKGTLIYKMPQIT